MKDKEQSSVTPQQLRRVQKAGLQVEVLNETLQAQVIALDDDELQALERIKTKLNSGIDDEALRNAATTVGAIVW